MSRAKAAGLYRKGSSKAGGTGPSRATLRREREAAEAAMPHCAECQCVIYPNADGTLGKACKRCGKTVAP